MPAGTSADTLSTDDNETGLAVTSTITSYSLQPDNTSRPEFAIQLASSSHSNVEGSLEEADDDDEPPKSVIHAPPGFNDFIIYSQQTSRSDALAHSERERHHHIPPTIFDGTEKNISNDPSSPSPLTTAIESTKDWFEQATPRAQTMRDFDEKSHSGNLEDILEGAGPKKAGLQVGETGTFNLTIEHFSDGETELKTLKIALAECWSLCNTLASLSYIHRQRSNIGADMQEEAWKSCWRLCQELYTCQNKNYTYQISPTLDLCQKFCQTLFDNRVHENELTDSVLRVSFELNNHLYNTHDRDLPDAFRERTLDFYITLCHRLMKQRALVTEMDSLLSACWSLAEMLFSIRQSKKEGGRLSEELLGSAVQACWELCDIFREGWTTQRSLRDSDRGTPRPSQAIFNQIEQTSQPRHSLRGELHEPNRQPETPTTIFEDATAISPDEEPIPNIFILSQGSPAHNSHVKCSSNSSNTSTQTHSFEHISSTNTVTISTNDPNVSCLRILVTKAATNSGYQRNGPQSLSSFVKSLSSDAFGSLPWQISLLANYKRLVGFDPVFQNAGPQAQASALDISSAVQEMMQRGKLPWLCDLYRLVFGFHVEEAINWKGPVLQT
ncbi:hypothetical protein ABOM_011026 [Aspergillus bombycis]|uniref:DUF7624 domain-containing protein n=1 Tax=Aspergillus bombycis TaxID=109264 RepID=A0A1F7ZJZ2_9EURO|nr:hypothetical protein ABOM_011026 [Aspergillus bombycis]OGM39762.1 hypothetical protein ABOM_011026 [Aspergillus bombycis]